MFSNNRTGSAVVDVTIAAAIIVFVILPVFSSIVEKYILLNKAQIIKDAMDMTNISVYNAMITGSLGKETVDIEYAEAEKIFRDFLSINLKLEADLTPTPKSIADSKVAVDSLMIYISGFPCICPDGVSISRPAVHSSVNVPIKPTLYRQLILDALGKDYIILKVHVDSDIPLNN